MKMTTDREDIALGIRGRGAHARIDDRGDIMNRKEQISGFIERTIESQWNSSKIKAVNYALLETVVDNIYSKLEREYEYQTSQEIIEDNIRANEYEFSEKGERA